MAKKKAAKSTSKKKSGASASDQKTASASTASKGERKSAGKTVGRAVRKSGKKAGAKKNAAATDAGSARGSQRLATTVSQSKLEKLHKLINVMGEMVEHNVTTAVMSLIDRDVQMAREVFQYEEEVNQMELEIDKLCCELLLEAHPEEATARFIYSVIKINMELERISDLTVVIGYRVIDLAKQNLRLPAIFDLTENLEIMEELVRDAITALLEENIIMAYSIINRHDKAVESVNQTIEYLCDLMEAEPEKIRRAMLMYHAMHAMLRIIEQVTNIAEEVVYLVEGISVKHRIPNQRS